MLKHHRRFKFNFLALEYVQIGDFAQGLLKQIAALGLVADCDDFDALHNPHTVFPVFPLDLVYLRLSPFRHRNFFTVLELTYFTHVPVAIFFAPILVMAVIIRAYVFAAAFAVAI